MNERGVAMFMAYRPFEKLFRVLLSPRYLPAMKRKRQNHHAADFCAFCLETNTFIKH